MKKLTKPLLIVIILILGNTAFAELNLTGTVNSTYQIGQYLDKEESQNLKNSKPLNWAFNGLASEKPIFVSGGDTGKVLTIPMEDGVIIYLPHSTGTSVFTIWSNGESFWGKQTKLNGTAYSQQFIGGCEN